MSPDLHPDVAPLAFLVGTWRGRGHGDYPTVEAFQYDEEAVISHSGKPFLAYHQRTWGADGSPLHTECGYFRPAGAGRAELVVAQPTGVVEVHAGPVRATSLVLDSVAVGLSPTAKDVRTVRRTLTVAGRELRYRLDMEAVGQGLQFHLEATLHAAS